MLRLDSAAEYRRFVLQKQLVEKHFPCFRCTLRGDVLGCIGEIVPSENCDAYQLGIRYKFLGIPEVRVRKPRIEKRVHMYRDDTLCLYDHREQPWNSTSNLHETVIPWAAEWLVFYELYLLYGKWLGPEAPHGEGQSKQVEETKTPSKT